jgi:hypothetical protein
MKERNNNQLEAISHPPAWCGAICRNAMNEICVEHCAIERDCSGFEEKPNLKLAGMPRFPKTDGMTKEEKFTSVTVYLAKVVDHLNGIDDEHHPSEIYQAPQSARSDSSKAIAEVIAGIRVPGMGDE